VADLVRRRLVITHVDDLFHQLRGKRSHAARARGKGV
jgi:hypothetical protein